MVGRVGLEPISVTRLTCDDAKEPDISIRFHPAASPSILLDRGTVQRSLHRFLCVPAPCRTREAWGNLYPSASPHHCAGCHGLPTPWPTFTPCVQLRRVVPSLWARASNTSMVRTSSYPPPAAARPGRRPYSHSPRLRPVRGCGSRPAGGRHEDLRCPVGQAGRSCGRPPTSNRPRRPAPERGPRSRCDGQAEHTANAALPSSGSRVLPAITLRTSGSSRGRWGEVRHSRACRQTRGCCCVMQWMPPPFAKISRASTSSILRPGKSFAKVAAFSSSRGSSKPHSTTAPLAT